MATIVYFFQWLNAMYICVNILAVLVRLPYSYGLVAIPPQSALNGRVLPSANPAARTPSMYVVIYFIFSLKRVNLVLDIFNGVMFFV